MVTRCLPKRQQNTSYAALSFGQTSGKKNIAIFYFNFIFRLVKLMRAQLKKFSKT